MAKGLVVITGASAGIGKATALGFARLGHPLALGARRIEKLAEAAGECRKAGAPEVKVLPLDVRDKASIDEFARACGTPEILVNNAGMARGRDSIDKLVDEDIVDMIETNVTGFLRVARAFLPGMVAAKKGHVINMGSYAAHGAYEGGAVYVPTKHAVRAVSQVMRLELSGTNIRVTEVQPGLVETEFSVIRHRGDESQAKNVYKGFTPLVAEDIADVILWAATRPAHVNISEVVLTPTAQASLTKVHKT